MAQASYQQTSFLGGELSKFAQGMADKPGYRTGMNVCLNGLPAETGTWVRRPGTKFLAVSNLGLPARIIPFEFKQSTPYMLEFTNGSLRFFAGALSGLPGTTTRLAYSQGNTIASISAANPAVIATVNPHGWITNNQVEVLGTNVVELQNRQLIITVLSATTFSIGDEQGLAIDGSTLTAFLVGTVVLITVKGAPYLTADLPAIRSVQAETKSVLLHGSYPPWQLAVTSLQTPIAYADFSIAPAALIDGPYLDPVSNSTMAPNATTGTITLTQTGPLVNDGAGFTAADIGRKIRVFSEPPTWPGSGTGLAGDVVKFGGGYWIQQVNATTAPPGAVGAIATTYQGQIDRSGLPPSIQGISSATTTTPQWLPLTVGAAAAWCYGTIINFLGPQQIVVTFNRALVSTSTINTWRLGVYGGPNGYPTCGGYVDGRLWLGGAVPNRVDASVSNDIFNFSPSLADGTVLDNSAIAAIFNSDGSNQIFWMEQDQQGIVCGTQAGEWLISSSNAGFTPTNIRARRVTKIGCANIEPRRTDHTLVGVQAFKREIFEYFADVYSGKFSAPDITATWKHLTIGNVQEIAYQQELIPVIWARVNNRLVGCTYKRDTLTTSQGPNIAAGHRHTLGSGRNIEGIATGGNDTGTLDALFMVTNDPATNIRHIEMFMDMPSEGNGLADAMHVDSATSPVSILPSSAGAYGGLTFPGLSHLNGKTVTAWIGGLDCGDFTVVNGQITVPYGDGIGTGTANGLFTADFVNSFGPIANMHILIGFTFTSQGQIVRPATPAESGARNGPAFGKKRRTHQYAAQLEGTQGVSFGTDFATARMQAAIFRNPDNSTYSITAPFAGIHVDSVIDDYSYDGMLAWQITRPYPCNVVAIGGFLETMDR